MENTTVAQLDRATASMGAFSWKIEELVKRPHNEGYILVKVPGHPSAHKNGYMLEHRLVMQIALGRLLDASEVVHHKDGNKKNNSLENLELIGDSEHARIHGLITGRKMVKLKCPSCDEKFDREIRQTFLQKPAKYKATCCSPKCRGILYRNIQLHGLTPKVERAISENLLFEYRRYLKDNAEETETTGSVETIRTSPETVKT